MAQFLGKYKIDDILLVVALIEGVLLTPTMFLYAVGMIFAVFYATLGETIFLFIGIVFGYALFSLWWLVVKFRNITFSQVPYYIWPGFLLGIIIAIWYAYGSATAPHPDNKDFSYAMKIAFISGGGPLIILFTNLLIIFLRKKE